LSKVHISGTAVGARRGAGFAASLKTVAVVSIAPALLMTVVAFVFTGIGAITWIGFSLFFGIRVVFVYMGRFRNKAKKIKAAE
jgi:hypothetical protein